jgi:RNA polymerase sigma-70 factor (ECF subfamily)
VTLPAEPTLNLASAFKAHQRDLLGLTLRITGNLALAEDALQETFLAAHAAAGGFRHEARPSTWLYRIATREALRVRANARRHADGARSAASRTNRSDTPDPGQPAAWIEHTRALLDALDQLPEEQRLALVLLTARAIPAEEIADLLGVPANTVYTRAFRARVRLKEIMAHAPAGA